MKYKEAILKISPKKNQPINETVSHWWQLQASNPHINDYIVDGKISISRTDLFQETDSEKRLMGVLLWGYPKGMRGGYLNAILNNRKTILSAIHNKSSNYQELIGALESIKGLGLATITKILYFYGIKTDEGHYIPIIDHHVRETMSLFEDFHGLSMNQDLSSYIRIVSRVISQLETKDIKYDDLEFFMFEFGQYWKENNAKYKHQCFEDFVKTVAQ